MAAGQGRLTTSTVSVTPGQTYTITVGAGGKGGLSGTKGSNGGASSAFGVTGAGGVYGTSYTDGKGGTCGSNSTYWGTRAGTGQTGWVSIQYKKEKEKVLSDEYRLVRYEGNTYIIASVDAVNYARYDYKVAGTYSLKIPANVNEIYVTGCGGGAGGATLAAYNSSPNITITAGDGGDTVVDTFVIAGGKGGTAKLASGNSMTVSQPNASTPNGVEGATKTCRNVDFTLYGSGFIFSKTANVITADIFSNVGYYQRYSTAINSTTYVSKGTVEAYGVYGAGGGSSHFYDSDGTSNQLAIAGNSGAFVVREKVAVTPDSTITIKVGAGGRYAYYSTDSDNDRYKVTDGTNGFVIIEWGASAQYMPLIKETE